MSVIPHVLVVTPTYDSTNDHDNASDLGDPSTTKLVRHKWDKRYRYNGLGMISGRSW